jgi:hypothetical protein
MWAGTRELEPAPTDVNPNTDQPALAPIRAVARSSSS